MTTAVLLVAFNVYAEETTIDLGTLQGRSNSIACAISADASTVAGTADPANDSELALLAHTAGTSARACFRLKPGSPSRKGDNEHASWRQCKTR